MKISITVEIGAGRPDDVLTDVSWGRLRQIIKRRDKATCYHCGVVADKGQVDHLIPLSKGGTDSPDNLVWSCPDCNLSKGDSVPAGKPKADNLLRRAWQKVKGKPKLPPLADWLPPLESFSLEGDYTELDES